MSALWIVVTKDHESLFGPFENRWEADAFRDQFTAVGKWARVRSLIEPERAA